jgi:hypothetical protein
MTCKLQIMAQLVCRGNKKHCEVLQQIEIVVSRQVELVTTQAWLNDINYLIMNNARMNLLQWYGLLHGIHIEGDFIDNKTCDN